MKEVILFDSDVIRMPASSGPELEFVIKIHLRNLGIDTEQPITYWYCHECQGTHFTQEEAA